MTEQELSVVTCSACLKELSPPRDINGRVERFWYCPTKGRAATAK